ncbi:MAG: NAD(P)H-binding protein [Planctomycetota bacterium]
MNAFSGPGILVTGAAGMVGRGLVEVLVAGRRPVRALLRSELLRGDIEAFGAEVVVGDVRSPAVIEASLDGITSIIHLAEAPRAADPQSEFVAATQCLLEAARQLESFDIFIYVSALGARADARSAFLRAKWRCEQLVQGSQLAHVIVRPAAVYAPDDAFINSLAYQMTRWRVLPSWGASSVRVQPLSRSELVAALAASLDHPWARNRAFDVGGPEALTLKEIMTLLRERMNMATRYLPLPLTTALKVATQARSSIEAGFSPAFLEILKDMPLADNTAFLEVFPLVMQPLREGLRGYALPKGA